jgi:hypothetical protein
MNDLGIISGWFTDSNNVDNGFEDIAGRFTTYSDPLAGTKDAPGDYLEAGYLGSELVQLNDGGVLSGEYIDAKGVSHGAEEIDGRYITINEPNASETGGNGSSINYVNNLGAIVGEYIDPKGHLYGYLDQDGKFTTISPPAGTEGTEAEAIDNAGVIIGDYSDSKDTLHGFVDQGGKYTTINDPNAGTATGQGTVPIDTPLSFCP